MDGLVWIALHSSGTNAKNQAVGQLTQVHLKDHPLQTELFLIKHRYQK